MKGTKEIAQRIINAENNFCENLLSIAGIQEDDAMLVLKLYLKNKLAKLDISMGKVYVKHGAYLEEDVLLNAVRMAKG